MFAIGFSYIVFIMLRFSSVQFSHSVVSNSLQPHELQHARPPCPSPTPRVHPNSCPSSQWCHPAISSSVIPFSSCPQSFQASGSFQMSQPFTSGGQSIGVSASTSVLPMNTQDWSPLGWTGWISLQSKGLSRVEEVFLLFLVCWVFFFFLNYEWILNFIKYFFCISWIGHVIFVLHSVNLVSFINWFCLLRYLCLRGINHCV